jgi:hypothetical protein
MEIFQQYGYGAIEQYGKTPRISINIHKQYIAIHFHEFIIP